jgi:hypothetical protein
VIIGFELRASSVLPLEPCPQPFLLYFSDRVSAFYPSLASNCDPPTSVSQIHGTASMHHHAETCFFFFFLKKYGFLGWNYTLIKYL